MPCPTLVQRTFGSASIYVFIVVAAVGLYIVWNQFSSVDPDKQVSVAPDRLNCEGDNANKPGCQYFVVIIDAGSTGTRVHVFQFRPVHDSVIPFALVNEGFQENKPPLSFFTANPEDAPQTLVPLLDFARGLIPEELWSSTPLTLKATAGLRLLPVNISEAILAGVKHIFNQYPFPRSADAVSVLTGTDEGVFGWFTLNYLLEQLHIVFNERNKQRELEPVALDLGGGSTQITFIPRDEQTIKLAPESFVIDFSLFETVMLLYTHSYLGNGLVEARRRLLGGDGQVNPKELPESSCFPEDYKLNWNYNMVDYIVSGSSEYSFESCHSSLRQLVERSKINRPSEIDKKRIYGFSYLFDRGRQAGLVDSNSGGWISVEMFKTAAKQSCARLVTEFGPEHWQPWQCLDLSYIYTLLTDGYGLSDHTQIHLTKKLDGKETSWGLGAAFNELSRVYSGRPFDAAYAFYFSSTLNSVYTMCLRLLMLFGAFTIVRHVAGGLAAGGAML